jgi:hypothetical protein
VVVHNDAVHLSILPIFGRLVRLNLVPGMNWIFLESEYEVEGAAEFGYESLGRSIGFKFELCPVEA